MLRPVEEYKGPGPGCFKCKEPLEDQDFVEVTWRGKTWAISYRFCEPCWQPAQEVLSPATEPDEYDPLHGRQISL